MGTLGVILMESDLHDHWRIRSLNHARTTEITNKAQNAIAYASHTSERIYENQKFTQAVEDCYESSMG